MYQSSFISLSYVILTAASSTGTGGMCTWESCTSILTCSSSSILDNKFHNKTLPDPSGPHMYLAINFIHFLHGQADKNKQKLGAFVLNVIFVHPCLNLLYTHCFITKQLSEKGPSDTLWPRPAKRADRNNRRVEARCGKERSRIKRLGHGAVSGH